MVVAVHMEVMVMCGSRAITVYMCMVVVVYDE